MNAAIGLHLVGQQPLCSSSRCARGLLTGCATDGGAPLCFLRIGACTRLLTQAAFPLPKAFPQNLQRRSKWHVPTPRQR